jgi:hypothetical protein
MSWNEGGIDAREASIQCSDCLAPAHGQCATDGRGRVQRVFFLHAPQMLYTGPQMLYTGRLNGAERAGAHCGESEGDLRNQFADGWMRTAQCPKEATKPAMVATAALHVGHLRTTPAHPLPCGCQGVGGSQMPELGCVRRRL